MPLTRNNPRIESGAALGHLFRALLIGLVAFTILTYEFELRRLVIQVTGSPTWRGIGIVPTFALLVGILASMSLVATIRRTSRWLTARRHVRMLKDPLRAALVPPLPSHLQSLTPTPGRRIWQRFGYLLFAAALLGVLALATYVPTSEPEALEDQVLMWGFAIFLLGASVYGLADTVLRWRRSHRAARASRAGGLAREFLVQQPVERASRIPPLSVSFAVPHAVSKEPRAVTAERNVFGRPPWNIAYLRLFDNESGLQHFLKGSWRQCGHVHFIRDADSVSRDEIRAIEDGAPLFIDSHERLLADLDARPGEPLPAGERKFTGLAAETVDVDDVYGSYPVYAPLCHDGFWKAAVDVILERADAVVLDLSGYHWDNLGTGYELQRVVDRFPIERSVFLADPAHTDKPFLEAQIQRAWSQMASGSPNAGDAPRQVIVAQPDVPAGNTSGALASMLQERLELVESYAARIRSLSPEGAAEQESREALRRQMRDAARRRPRSTLRVLLRLWGLTRS